MSLFWPYGPLENLVKDGETRDLKFKRPTNSTMHELPPFDRELCLGFIGRS
jgi:hypothetical protein